MKKQDFEKLKESLEKRGYKIYNQKLHHEDYMLCKGFHKKDNKWDDDRSGYQIMLLIYDYSEHKEYWSRLPENMRNYVGIQVEIGVSRIVDERIDLTLMWGDNTDIEEIERAAERFYSWVITEWLEPKKI